MSQTLKLVLLSVFLAACSSDSAVLGKEGADEAVMAVVQGLGKNQPEVIWQALPGSYQQDVTSLVKEFATQMEGGIWDQVFSTLGKLTRVLDEKRAFLMEHPLVSQQLSQTPNATETYDSVVKLLQAILNSDISSLQRLREFDGERFLATTGNQVMVHMQALAALAPTPAMDVSELQGIKATLSRTEEDHAWVKIEKPGEEPEEVEFAKVEGKWVPVSISSQWETEVGKAREQIAGLAASQQENSAQVMMALGLVNGALDSLLAAQTAEEFQNTLQGMVGLAMMQMMGAPEAAAEGE